MSIPGSRPGPFVFIHAHLFIYTHVTRHGQGTGFLKMYLCLPQKLRHCLPTYLYTHTYIHIYNRLYATLYVSIYTYIHTYIYIYIHTHIYTHKSPSYSRLPSSMSDLDSARNDSFSSSGVLIHSHAFIGCPILYIHICTQKHILVNI
jgi:hypothetical protein